MPSVHRLQRGLRGYLILYAPHAFVRQRQKCSSKLPLHLVFLPISTDFTPTPAIPLASSSLEFISLNGRSGVKLQALTFNLINHLRTLYAQ